MNIKKYLVFLPLIAGCNGLGKNNNIGQPYNFPTQSMYKDDQGTSSSTPGGNESSAKPNIVVADVAIAGNSKPGGKQPDEKGNIHGLIHRFGDDASFFKFTNSKYILGMADGIGATGPVGGDYAEELMSEIASSDASSPKAMLIDAQNKILERPPIIKNDLYGSTTACVVTIDEDYIVKSANIGDSGMMVVRNNQIVFETEKKVKEGFSFNCPDCLHRCEYDDMFGSFTEEMEDICICQEYKAKSGDVVILSTDGLWDNLYKEAIIEEIKPGLSAQEIANNIKTKAFNVSQSPDQQTPFQDNAIANGWKSERLKGGKSDDINIIVAIL